jgi:hypothetical protein
LTILVATDRAYLPGAVAVYNSAMENGFAGQTVFLTAADRPLPENFPPAPRLSFRKYQSFGSDYIPNVNRLAALLDLPPGKYLLLDADVVIERPLGRLLGMVDEAPLVSLEPEPKFSPQDVRLAALCRRLKLRTDLQSLGYINCGIIGFSLPRDAPLIHGWAKLSREHLPGVRVGVDLDLYNPEQEILNALAQQPTQHIHTLSPRCVELGSYSLFHNRPFPHSRQAGMQPVDQLKYLIHGASLRRPWLIAERPAWRNWGESAGLLPLYRRCRGKVSAYERAWVYYACSPRMPLPMERWAPLVNFRASQNFFWRLAYA